MPVTHPLVKEGILSLRRYQESIIARAMDENTLVVLPTGLGKTIVAAMVAAHRLHKYPESRVLLLAPTKPLVMQHMKTFNELLTVEKICVLTGGYAIEKRKSLWVENRIIFATPQTIENDIIRGLDLSDVSLIVFDEAHRTVGDYSYVSIARDYVKKSNYPMTLGLTASPSSDREKVREICANLHIKHVEAKTDLDSDVREYIQDVKIRWVNVELPEEFRQVQKLLQDVLRIELKRLKELSYIESTNLTKVNKRLLLSLQQMVRAEITAGVDAYEAASIIACAIKVNHGIELLETQGISAVYEYFKRLKTQKTKAVKRLMGNPLMMKAITKVSELKDAGIEHPKIDELVRIVSRYKGKKVLVFTQYRDSVDSIIQRLNEADILTHEFIGQASRGLRGGMTQKKQMDVLERFSEGAYSALIATSVAEEGLDIPKVDAVIFYEPVPSEIRTIQRRGRTGRSATGEVYILIAKGTRDEGYYWASLHKERKMGDIVRDMRKGLKEQMKIGRYEGDVILDEGGDKQRIYNEPLPSFGQQSLVTYSLDKSERVKIIVDFRERNNTILTALKDKCEVELRQLAVGDYLLSDRVCVERKTMEDFLQSITDKRLMNQLAEMRRNFQIPLLILEKVDMLYAQRNIHPNAIRGALAAIACDFNVPIIPSEDEEDTAQILYTIAKREQEDNERVIALRGERKPELLNEKQRFIVESLPNVSAILADRLLQRFSSVQAVMAATQKELQEIEGIGSKKAQEIRKVVKNSYKGEKR